MWILDRVRTELQMVYMSKRRKGGVPNRISFVTYSQFTFAHPLSDFCPQTCCSSVLYSVGILSCCVYNLHNIWQITHTLTQFISMDFKACFSGLQANTFQMPVIYTNQSRARKKKEHIHTLDQWPLFSGPKVILEMVW